MDKKMLREPVIIYAYPRKSFLPPSQLDVVRTRLFFPPKV
jgi:hypothetical protein